MESDTVRTLKVNHSIIERRSLSFDLRSRKFERSYLIGGLLGRLGIMDTETLAVPEKGYTSSHNSCLRVNVCSKNGTIPANSQVTEALSRAWLDSSRLISNMQVAFTDN